MIWVSSFWNGDLILVYPYLTVSSLSATVYYDSKLISIDFDLFCMSHDGRGSFSVLKSFIMLIIVMHLYSAGYNSLRYHGKTEYVLTFQYKCQSAWWIERSTCNQQRKEVLDFLMHMLMKDVRKRSRIRAVKAIGNLAAMDKVWKSETISLWTKKKVLGICIFSGFLWVWDMDHYKDLERKG